MKVPQSKYGWIFALVYIFVCSGLIVSQGLFGESFIAVILGLPWSLVLAFFEYGNASGSALYILVLAPLVLNALLLYWIGALLQGRKIAKVVAVVVGVLVVVGVVYAMYPRSQPVEESIPSDVPYQGTVTGTYLCLPHVDTSGPQTLECALGLQTDDGKYYALDFNLLSQMLPSFVTGARITVSGTITPVANLSSDHWQKYPITGIVSVTNANQADNLSR